MYIAAMLAFTTPVVESATVSTMVTPVPADTAMELLFKVLSTMKRRPVYASLDGGETTTVPVVEAAVMVAMLLPDAVNANVGELALSVTLSVTHPAL